jgi:hypothetical protein
VKPLLLSVGAALALTLAAPTIASADVVDLSTGAMGTNGSTSFTTVATLHGPGIGLVGLHPQVSFAVPFNGSGTGGRYAATAEGAVPLVVNNTYIGGGLGVGRLDATLPSGALYDVFAGTRVAPHLDLVARYYDGLTNNVGHGLYGGLAFRL